MSKEPNDKIATIFWCAVFIGIIAVLMTWAVQHDAYNDFADSQLDSINIGEQ